MLSIMQKDLLKELVNVYIGQAAASLSEMVQQKIILSIPEVELVIAETIESNIIIKGGVNTPSHVVSSSIGFGNSFSGKAYLIFPADQAKNIVNACLDENEPSSDLNSKDLLDTDFDVLREISNVILNAIIGEFGNFLAIKLDYSLPEIEIINISDSDKKLVMQNELYMLILHTNFILAEALVSGTVIIALGINSITLLIDKIDEVLGGLNE